MRTFAIVCLLILCAGILSRRAYAWSEPDHFMGIKFWQPIRDSLKECRKERLGKIDNYKTHNDSDGMCWESVGSGDTYEIMLTTDGLIATGLSHVYAYTIENKLAFLDRAGTEPPGARVDQAGDEIEHLLVRVDARLLAGVCCRPGMA